MDKISDITITECEKSKYIKPLRLNYKQNGKKETADLILEHDEMVSTRFGMQWKCMIAIYLQRSKVTVENGQKVIKHEENPATLGITFELCAGIRDKEASLEELAQAEVLEECGYKVPLEKFEKFCSARAGVGTTGALMTMFYVEVTDDMKVSQGGGIVEEGEFIDVVDIPVSEAMNFAMDESINKPVAMMMGVLWFFQNKHKQSNL